MCYWIQTLLFLIFSIQAFSEDINDLPYSAPDQIVALTQESGRIGQVINPLSGQPCLRQIDLIAKGAQDVILRRMFISQHRDWYSNQALLMSKGLILHPQNIESGWVIFPNIRLDHLTIAKRKHGKNKIIKNEVRVVDQNGVALTFALKPDGQTELVDQPFGICNSHSLQDIPSGQYDLRNTRIVKSGNSIEVHSSTGSLYHYAYWSSNTSVNEDTRLKVEKSNYLLTKEVLPNGKVLRYRYNKKRDLVRVESMDPKERQVYAFIDIDSSPHLPTSTFSTNTGMSAFYFQTPSRQLKTANTPPKDTRALNLLSIKSAATPFYSKETLAFDKSLLSHYAGRRNQFTCHYAESGESHSKNQRVSKLLLPVDGKEFYPVHEFSYEPPIVGEKPGKTCVKNIDGSYVVYHYSDKLLLTATLHFDANSILKKKKTFHWTDNHWLSSLAVHDGNEVLLYKKAYQYDASGNPVVDDFYGDITGNGHYETISTKREFSDDGRNLLIKETNDEGKTLCFQYLPNTNLITAKLTKDLDQIFLREFFDYDDCNNLIKKIEDNGTTPDQNNLLGVTQRKITNTILRDQPPFLHLPEWVEEKYLENGSEKLLRRTHLAYDTQGNVREESIYGADNLLAYTLNKAYDDRGNLTLNTNAIAQEAIFDYDDKGRCILSTNFSKTLRKKMEYDERDRLITIEETGQDQIVHTRSFAYDLNDNLIRKVDPFINITEYGYDPLCHKVIRTSSPPILDSEGKCTPVTTTSTYDSFGRELSKTCANGNMTTFRYGGHTLPIDITHPDGSVEIFTYTRNGLLESHIDRDHLITSYEYDILGRVVLKAYRTKEEEVAKETFVYDSFRLIEKTDREGNKTSYSYDGAGRLIKEETSGKVTHYCYDSLGRILTTINENGENSLYTHYKKDLLDRILEKQCTDRDGKVLSQVAYSYDEDSNISGIHRQIDGKEATETFTYDSFQRQIETIDALGNKTRIIYDENCVNKLGQKVLCVATIDPKNKSVIKTEDSYGRVVQEDVLNSENKLISSQEMKYDPNGNLLTKKNLIFENGQYKKTLETKYCYTPCNQVACLTRASNSPNSRTTLYSYTPGGKTASKTKPDGTVISYCYHPFGRLKTVSSDKLQLNYEYNLLGDLVQATDERNNIWIKRQVDPYGNVLSETLSTGLAIKKTYDALNRPLSIDLPDQGQILYTYDPLFLRTVSRTSRFGDVLYTHSYTDYDLSGYLQEESLIGALGTVKHTYDVKGRSLLIKSPYFDESLSYDAADNIIAIKTNSKDVHYTYDELGQLISEAENTYLYDTNYNRIKENGAAWTSNELDELLSTDNAECSYDLNGNLLSKKTSSETLSFTYDPFDRLTQVVTNNKKIKMVYDPLGRRLSKTIQSETDSIPTTEHYLYDGENDIGAFTPQGVPLQLRALGLNKTIPSTVAIELEGQVFAPIQDFQSNIRYLIRPSTEQKIAEYHFSAFGRENAISETIFNPYRYASKRLDPETNLINFGKRYYDTDLSRWITTDPAGFIDGMNLYGYVKNNPYRYNDQNGLFAIPLVFIPSVIEISFAWAVSWITAEAVVATVAVTALSVGVYQLDKALDNNDHDIVMNNEAVIEEIETEQKKKGRKSPYGGDELGDDPTKCPGEGFTWKGIGPPGSGKGAWHNGKTNERFYPDLDHPPPKDPHWDYSIGKKTRYEERLFLDGTWEPKK